MQLEPQMHVISVNVGLPREVLWKRRTVLTGIFKEPVAGRVAVEALPESWREYLQERLEQYSGQQI